MGFEVFRYCFGCMQQRYLMGLMAFFGIAIAYILRNCLSMAIVDMVGERHKTDKNHTSICPNIKSVKAASHKAGVKGKTFSWSESRVGNLMGCFFIGYVVTHVPGGLAADYLGAKHVFSGGVLISAICSLLSPVCADLNYWFLYAIRIIMGLGQGVLFPAANVLLARWIPPVERGKMGAAVLAATQIGNVLSNSVSGLIMTYLGWHWVFYTWGIIGIIWYLIFIASVYSDPSTHPFIKDEEREYLAASLAGVTDRKDVPPLPVLSIMTSAPVWALIICQIGHNYGLFTMQNFYPKYMKSVLRFSAAKNGIYSSIPYLAMWFTAITSGILIDWIINKEYLSRVMTRRIFALIAQIGPGFGCVLAVHIGCNRILSILLMTIGMALMGPFFPSMKVNALDLAPNYAGFLMAIINGIGAFAGFFSGGAYSFIIKDHETKGQWLALFWLSNAMISFSGIFYAVFMSAELQKWNNPAQGGQA